jgi:hypothetical protein
LAGRRAAPEGFAPPRSGAERATLWFRKVTEILGASSARGQSDCFLGGCPQSEAAPGCRQTHGVGRGRGPRIVARRRVHRHRRRLRLQLSSVQTVRAPNPRDGNDDPRFCPNGRNAVNAVPSLTRPFPRTFRRFTARASGSGISPSTPTSARSTATSATPHPRRPRASPNPTSRQKTSSARLQARATPPSQ